MMFSISAVQGLYSLTIPKNTDKYMYALCARNDVDHKITRNRTHKNRSPRPGINSQTFSMPCRHANHYTCSVLKMKKEKTESMDRSFEAWFFPLWPKAMLKGVIR